jgi:hypothetical protein
LIEFVGFVQPPPTQASATLVIVDAFVASFLPPAFANWVDVIVRFQPLAFVPLRVSATVIGSVYAGSRSLPFNVAVSVGNAVVVSVSVPAAEAGETTISVIRARVRRCHRTK